MTTRYSELQATVNVTLASQVNILDQSQASQPSNNLTIRVDSFKEVEGS